MTKKLHNDLLQSAIIGTEQRRDKALQELIRYQSRLDELRKKAARMAKRAAKERAAKEQAKNIALTHPLDPITQATLLTQPQRDDDDDSALDIPAWLLRRRVDVQKKKDQEAAEQIKAEQVERRRAKSLVRVGKMKAKQRGDTRKMPLSGKDALKFIKEGA